MPRRLLFVQSGFFRDGYKRFIENEPETYRDQRLSVGFICGLAPDNEVFIASLDGEYDERTLTPGLHAVGLDRKNKTKERVRQVIDYANPDIVVLRTPDLMFMREVGLRGVRTLPTLADIFTRGRFRAAVRNMRASRALHRLNAVCVANHNLNASLSMARSLRIPENKIVPWDWSKLTVNPGAKTGVVDPDNIRLFYAGSVTEAKGVGDCIAAIRLLRDEGLSIHMSIAGSGKIEEFRAQAESHGVLDCVEFVGKIPHNAVQDRMRGSDIVVVPSRHEYPEGFPNTIYEALASRTPLIISDHPAFEGRLRDGMDCLIFEAKNTAALAGRIRRLAEDSNLYGRVSSNSAEAHDNVYAGMLWTDLVETFLNDPDNSSGWVEANSLSTLS